MATANGVPWEAMQNLEQLLQASVADSRVDLQAINHQLAEYRVYCDAVIFLDCNYVLNRMAEHKLWDNHSLVNSRYRKQLNQFREGGGKRKVVEQRKLMKNYLDFIKSSQRYYRTYVQKLASNFGGIPELEVIARKFNVDRTGIEDRPGDSSETRDQVLLACHQSLIRLGDLSRYRETELKTKDRDWGPATGYYDLAGSLRPASGASHNQLAVIALTDGHRLRSTYHLYRALAVEEPHPTAKRNLEIGLKKILVAHERGELISHGTRNEQSGFGRSLNGWFMLLHAQCYKGVDFVGHDELENEVVSQLAVDLKERSLDGIMQKIVLVNIAAEYFAGVQVQELPESKEIRQAFFFFLRLNVKTMFTLLQVFQPELECLAISEEDRDIGMNEKGPERITAVARRVLPGLRQYSCWLTCNSALLAAEIGDNSLNVQIKELWRTYASTLTLLAASFSASDLAKIEYLLEEDEDTLGFKPFEKDAAYNRYHDSETGSRKPAFHAIGVERQHPNLEMVGRIRDFLTDGLLLALDDSVPIDLIEGTTTFAYREAGMPSELLASPQAHHVTLSSSVERSDIPRAAEGTLQAAVSINDDGASLAPSTSVSTNRLMNEMVDNIVGPEATTESEKQRNMAEFTPFRAPPTPPSYSFDDSPLKTYGNDTSYDLLGTATAHEFLKDTNIESPHQPSQHGTPRPLLPSIYNSVFAPTPDEISPRPGTAIGLSPARLPLQQPHRDLMQSSVCSMPDPSSTFSGHYRHSMEFATPKSYPESPYNGFADTGLCSPRASNQSP